MQTSSNDPLGQRVAWQQARVEPTQASEVQPSALRGFVVTPGFILAVAPTFRDWTSSARAGWEELDQAAFHIRSALGISPHAWGQARIMFGQEVAITALAAICARHAAGKVRSPGGLLRRMVELHQQGELRLDRTLFGLADKVRKEADATGASQPGRVLWTHIEACGTEMVPGRVSSRKPDSDFPATMVRAPRGEAGSKFADERHVHDPEQTMDNRGQEE